MTLTRAGNHQEAKNLICAIYAIYFRAIRSFGPVRFRFVLVGLVLLRGAAGSGRHGMARRGANVTRLRTDQTPDPLLLEDVRAPPRDAADCKDIGEALARDGQRL